VRLGGRIPCMTTRLPGNRGLDEQIAARGADSIWIGDKVQLRAREPSDADVIPQLERSADERSGWMIMPPRSRAATRTLFEESARKCPGPGTVEFGLAIVRREDDLMVGGITVNEADQVNGTFSYGVGIHPEHKGNGYAAEAVLLVLRFMFDERRFHKCEARVYDYNCASIQLHRKLGFTEEGRLRQHLFQAGGYHDELIFGMTAEEFRQLYPKLRPML
jgi:RimJ/RimL family protein N-acetyltransferase